MRPFFSYYGSKWTGAKHYGPPRHNLVIEPFAGSACYSTRWQPKQVKLYDASSDICLLWDFLINGSEADIKSIPDNFDSDAGLKGLSDAQRLLCGFWVAKGRVTPANVLSPWYHTYKNGKDCRVWGAAVKDRIISQKPNIAHWSIDCMDYRDIPLVEAHWHIDPPYNNKAGQSYPQQPCSFTTLAWWSQCLPGPVDICENEGADWLDFSPLYEVVSSRGRRDGGRSKEVVWRKHA